MPQAGHWVRLEDGRTFFYQTLNSCAYQTERYEKMYIAPGCVIELPAFWREMEENNVPASKIAISPVAGILQDIDGAFERGQVDFDGNKVEKLHDGTMKRGTTAHGAGANRARRVLRRGEAKYAKDVPELQDFLCDVPREVMKRLDAGQAGMMEIAQGFQLSYLLQDFFPYTTSRNCTVMAALDDAMIPPIYAGDVVINFRTFPIRINSKKWIAPDGSHLTWEEVEKGTEGVDYKVIDSHSGHGYDDQEELTWEQITQMSGSPEPIMEMTSVTKLPRRIFTFSKKNLEDAVKFNKTQGKIHLSINFANYVDHNVYHARGRESIGTAFAYSSKLGKKLQQWFQDNLTADQLLMVKLIGTGELTEDIIEIF
jgi:hypothetical protein